MTPFGHALQSNHPF